MTRRLTSLVIVASLIVPGCAAPANKFEIRPVGSVAEQARPQSQQIAYARGQLALGNAGTALEAFRKANRDQPDNAAALRGIADSYVAMGRQDLARGYYEAALAVTPHDSKLLQAVAATDSAPRASPSLTQQAEPAARANPTATAISAAPSATSVTAKLPVALAPQPERLASNAPRLERLSPGEVALVTTPKPLWQAVVVARTRVSTTVRWVPVRSASAQPPIRLLNAARRQGLAAHTRQALAAQGWRKLAIGDAPKIRASSIVLYPGRHEAVAKSLAARLGFRAATWGRGDSIVVLLGRDAAWRRPAQRRA